MQRLTIQSLVDEARRPRFAKCRVGAFVGELVALLQLTRLSVGKYYCAAVVGKPVRGRSTLFSRAAVAEILSVLNGRPVGYPSEPLLKLSDVLSIAAETGVELTRDALVWAVWRHANPNHPKAAGPAPTLPTLLVTPTRRRVLLSDTLQYLEQLGAK